MMYYDKFLMHEGKGHLDGGHSGRYPWGSGENPYQRYYDFFSKYNKLKAKFPDASDQELAEKLDCYDKKKKVSVDELNRKLKLGKEYSKQLDIYHAKQMAKEGMGASEIGRKLGKNESTIRGWLDDATNQSMTKTFGTADVLRDIVDKKRYVDVSFGSWHTLGVTESRMEQAIKILTDEGYHLEKVKVKQQGTSHETEFNVLTKPEVTYSELHEHKLDVKPIYDETKVYGRDGLTSLGMIKPESIDSKRVYIRYNEDGGLGKDGLIELRPGVEDINIGSSRYAQIRMAVDDSYYLKGMAVYSNNIPKGYDVVFNTNKHIGTPMMGTGDNSVLKKMKTKLDGTVNWDNPFGATISAQKTLDGKKIEPGMIDISKDHISKANIVNDEGDWDNWRKRLSSQFLSKQPDALAERQLGLDIANKKAEFEELKSLTNPAVKQKLLLEFADGCDRSAVDLKGAPLPGQRSHVLIPMPELKDNEVYAPNYKDGTVVALVRHPHEGTFAIPILTVKNTGSVGKEIIGDAKDAIGINKNVADRLSGADFDGDSVILIPQSSKVRVRSTNQLADLEGFDAKEEYPGYEGMKVITNQAKQIEMGKVSNLITDMTFQGAEPSELARATKHSQCIIDAEKHELNWKLSEQVNDIAELKKKYQPGGGASTIISRAKSPVKSEPERKDWWARPAYVDAEGKQHSGIDPKTGEKVYEYTGEVNLSGTLLPKLSTGESVRLKKQTGKGEHAGEYYYVQKDMATGKDVRKYVKEGEFEPEKTVYLNEERKTGRLYYAEKNPATGKYARVYVEESELKPNMKGEVIKVTGRTEADIPRMATVKDAYELTSGGSKENYGYHIEKLYADYANEMKALGNAARREFLAVEPIKVDPDAKTKYADEINSLNVKLRNAEANSPRERDAQRIAGKEMDALLRDHPDLSKENIRKHRGQAINAARERVGAKKDSIKLTDREWEAIQSGAISTTRLKHILDNCDQDILKEKATPRKTSTISPSMEALAKSMRISGFSRRDIADRLGISVSSVDRLFKG